MPWHISLGNMHSKDTVPLLRSREDQQEHLQCSVIRTLRAAWRMSVGIVRGHPPNTHPTLFSSLYNSPGSPAHCIHLWPPRLVQTWVLSSRITNSMALWASPLENFQLNPLFSTDTSMALLLVPSESINGTKVHPTAQVSESPYSHIQSLSMLLLTSAR